MTLYILRTCPYCQHVLQALKGRDADVEIVEVPAMHSARAELRDLTGQTWVPTLVDGDTMICDDDDAIIEYLLGKEAASAA